MDGKGKYNLDHVYCHTNESNNYIRANNTGAGGPDPMALLKENKQLKAMLLLYLDLIQEQSDQLLAKDKLLANMKDENETLKAKIERLERRVQVQQQKTSRSDRDVNANKAKEEKKENKSDNVKTTENKTTAKTVTTPSATASDSGKYRIREESSTSAESESIIGERNGKLISKIILHRVNVPGFQKELKKDAVEKETKQEEAETKTDKRSVEPMQTTKVDSDESQSCDSVAGLDQSQHGSKMARKLQGKRTGLLSCKRQYCTREWEHEEIIDEFNKEEAEALKSDEPMLEIPKWTIKEFTGLYSIEGTEDLSDDTFLKRHAKLEHDEKRRKKWDVQRIREQKTIERLKRRHCKDELLEAAENQEITSFYPTPDSIKYIQITDDLPVQAFGDGIPKLPPNDFVLPWSQAGTSHHQSTELQFNSHHASSFVYLKKRRRQYGATLASARRSMANLSFPGPAPAAAPTGPVVSKAN